MCFTVSNITSDSDAIDPKTGKVISEFFNFPIFASYALPVPSVLTSFLSEKNQSRNLVFPFFRLPGKRQKIILKILARFSIFSLSLEHDATGIDPIFLHLKLMSPLIFLLCGR
jgi:hypothetical protein